MRWLQRSQAVSPTARGIDAKTRGEDEDPAVHDSPALAEIFATLDSERPMRILDLGPALQTNLDFYTTIASGVRIVSLLRNEGLEGLRQLDAEAFAARLDQLLPVCEDGFALVLMWDLLNYLVDEQPSILARHLAAVSEHGGKVHAMVVNAPRMPAEPSRYELLDAGRLAYRPTTSRQATSPDCPPALVERWLAPFRVERSFLLRHGVREFIAVNG